MKLLNSGRIRQTYVLLATCVGVFALLSLMIPGMSVRLWLWTMGAALVTSAVCIVLFQIWLARVFARRDSAIELLNRITAGNLDLDAAAIRNATQSSRMSAAVRALVTTLERTIRRFAQLATDVTTVSHQISSRSRVLSRSAREQLTSTEVTSASVVQIDTSINTVRNSMEQLSANAEETSTSVLEMSASIEEVGRIADTLSEFVEQTGSAIEELIASINEVATNTESFSSFAIQTASSMVQMNATTEEIGKSTKQSSELARYVRDAANEGREAVSGTVDGMRRIQQAVDEAKMALGELAERSQEIGEIVRVIDEIAGQTNLLALNAAIIAAQAGERGKGFAVVADEIRDLSERTSVSTDEIRTLIQNVQKAVERAAEQMTLSADRVGDGVGLTARAEQVLDKILDLTARSTSSIAEIARATEEQARGSVAATAAIEEVTKMVQQTATATQQQSQTSRKIGEQATTVRDYTKHLKRAMSEQETGSRAISRAMENIMGLVQDVLESTSVLATESAAIVKSMTVIQQVTRESNVSIADLSQMSGTLSHESNLLNQELDRFALPSPAEGGSLTVATVLWHQLTLDPIHLNSSAAGYIGKAIHSNLVLFGEGAELVPGLAEKWEVLEQGHVYRFHLRHNVRFHNGRAFEAKDVHDSLVRLLLPENQSHATWLVLGVRGAADVLAGKTRSLAGIIVRDAHTVDIALQEPLAFFLSLLTNHEAAIIPSEDARDEGFRLHPIGAGPFKVEETREGQSIRLRRNRDYYLPGIPHLDELTFRLDLQTFSDVTEAFLRGELDVAHGVPPARARELQKDPRYAPYILQMVQLHTSYLGYDCSSPPFNRVEIRQAVNHAVNRDRINERIYAGQHLVARGLLPPGLLGYDANLRGYDYDPERARALMRQGGQAGGFSIEYRTWDSDELNNSGTVPLIIEDLEAIGIHVNVTRHAAAEARRSLVNPGHGLLFTGNWYADFPDSDNFFYIFFHRAAASIPGFHYHTADIDRQIVEARHSNDPDHRADIYRGLDQLVVKEAPLATLFHDRFFVLTKPHVRGLRTSLVPPPVRFADVWVERE